MGIDNEVLRKLYDYLAKKMSKPSEDCEDIEAALAQAEAEEALVHSRLHVRDLSRNEQGAARTIFPDCIITDVTSDAIALTHTDRPTPHPLNKNLFCMTPKDVENRFTVVVKTLMNQPFAQNVSRLVFLIDTPQDVTAPKALEHERRSNAGDGGAGVRPFTDNEMLSQSILVDHQLDENGAAYLAVPRVNEDFGVKKVWGWDLKSLWKTSVLKPIVGKFIMENLVRTLRSRLPVELPRMQGVELIAEGAWPERGYFCATCTTTNRPLSSRDFVASVHQTPGEVDLKFLNFLNETFGEKFLVRSDDSDYQPILLLFYLRKMFEGRSEHKPVQMGNAGRVGNRGQVKYAAMPGIDDMPEVWIDRTTNAFVFKNHDNPDRYINIKCLLQLIASCHGVNYSGLTEEEAAVLNMKENEVDGHGDDDEDEDPRVIEFRRKIRRVHMPRTRGAASPSSYETLERLARVIVGVVCIIAFRKTDFTDSLELALSDEADDAEGSDEDSPEKQLNDQFASSAIKLSGKTIRFDKNKANGLGKGKSGTSNSKGATKKQSGKFSALKLVNKLFDHEPWYACFGVKFNPATREMEFQIDSDRMLMVLQSSFGLTSTRKGKESKPSSAIRRRFRKAITRLTWVLDYWSNQNVRVAKNYSAVSPPDGVPVRYHGLQVNPQTGQSVHGWRLVPASATENPNSTHIFTLPSRSLERKLVPSSVQNDNGANQDDGGEDDNDDNAPQTNNRYKVAFA